MKRVCLLTHTYTHAHVAIIKCLFGQKRSIDSRERPSNKTFFSLCDVCITNCLASTIFLFTVILILVRFPSTGVRMYFTAELNCAHKRWIILPSTYFCKHDLTVCSENVYLCVNFLFLYVHQATYWLFSLSKCSKCCIEVPAIFIACHHLDNIKQNLRLFINDNAMTY